MKRSNPGFTLIELLISMTLLSMVMLLGSWSFSTFTNKWEGRLGYFSKHVSQTKDLILLNDVLMSIIPYVYNVNKNPRYYFSLSNTELKAVTKNSIFHPGKPVAFRLYIDELENGSKFLTYQESVLTVLDQYSELNYTHEKILIAEADAISFRVFAWSNIKDKIRSEDPLNSMSNKKPSWSNNYQSKVSNLMPITVQISWDENLVNFPIQNDQGLWRTLISGATN